MASINTRDYSWSETEIRLNGTSLIGVTGVRWNEEQEKEYVRGKGNNPLGIKHGNKTFGGRLP
jgi:hypothetical protein